MQQSKATFRLLTLQRRHFGRRPLRLLGGGAAVVGRTFLGTSTSNSRYESLEKKNRSFRNPFLASLKKALSVNPSYDAAYSVFPGGMSSLEQKNKRLPLPREVAKKRGSQCYEWEVASVEDSHCLVAGVTPPGSQCRGVAGVAFPNFQSYIQYGI